MNRPQTLPVAAVVGTRVVNAAGEKIGRIEEVVIDLDTGRVAYAALSFGGLMGIGDKHFAVPWAALELDTQRKVFVLDVDVETLRQAPGFEQNNWPDVDLDYLDMLHTHYGAKSDRSPPPSHG